VSCSAAIVLLAIADVLELVLIAWMTNTSGDV